MKAPEGVELSGGDVQTTVQYLQEGSKNIRYFSKGVEVNIGKYEDVAVTVHDVRPRKEEFTLENGGFSLVQHDSKVTDFHSREQLADVYSPEILALVKSLTGADDVVLYSPPVLRQATAKADPTHQPRASDVHTDWSPANAASSAQQRATGPYSRCVYVNVWRALSPPPQDWPLAVIDARSVGADEGVAYPMIVVDEIPAKLPIEPQPEYNIEGANFCYREAHRWCYFKDMKINEVLAFKLFDSEKDSGVRSWRCPHTAFFDAREGTVPRESVEILRGDDGDVACLGGICQRLTPRHPRPRDVVWTWILRCRRLLVCANLLRTANSSNSHGRCLIKDDLALQLNPGLQSNLQRSVQCPLDLTLFTFGHQSTPPLDESVYSLLAKLYDLISIAGRSRQDSWSETDAQYICAQHQELKHPLSELDQHPTSSVEPAATSDLTTPHPSASVHQVQVLQRSISVLTSHLLFSSSYPNDPSFSPSPSPSSPTPHLTTSLRHLLSLSTVSPHNSTTWASLPGALLWSYAIGLRCSTAASDRTWFLMRFLQHANPYVLDEGAWEACARSLDVVVGALVG